MVPAAPSCERCSASAGVTTGSLAMQSSTCRSCGRNVANTSLATRSATEGPTSAYRWASASGSGAAPTARAVSTTAAHQPWVRRAIARATSGESVRAWAATRAADSFSSRRSRSPRSMVRWPSSSGARRVNGRSQREASSTRNDSGSVSSSASSARIVGIGSRWASSTTTSACCPFAARRASWTCSRSAFQAASAAIQVVSPARPVRRSQPAMPRVFPAPPGPISRVTADSVAASNLLHRRSRGT